jgi:hypothetical protein
MGIFEESKIYFGQYVYIKSDKLKAFDLYEEIKIRG